MKKPFLLLEVVIALFLVALIAFPLLQTRLKAMRAEAASLERAERERLADLSFAEVEEKLYACQVSWESLPAPGQRKGPFSLPSLSIPASTRPYKVLQRAFFLTCDENREKRGTKGEIYRLLKVEIVFSPPLRSKDVAGEKKPPSYVYSTLVRRVGSAKGEL